MIRKWKTRKKKVTMIVIIIVMMMVKILIVMTSTKRKRKRKKEIKTSLICLMFSVLLFEEIRVYLTLLYFLFFPLDLENRVKLSIICGKKLIRSIMIVEILHRKIKKYF